jgi:uncharacterized membrane protein
MVNPKVLLLLGAAVLVITTAIAIFMAVGYSPRTTTPTQAPSTTAVTSAPPG